MRRALARLVRVAIARRFSHRVRHVNSVRPAAADAVLRFWFEELTPEDWFRKDPSLDRRIAERFGPTLAAAARCELFHWRESARGRLAEVLVLDQFSRNIHRDTADGLRERRACAGTRAGSRRTRLRPRVTRAAACVPLPAVDAQRIRGCCTSRRCGSSRRPGWRRTSISSTGTRRSSIASVATRTAMPRSAGARHPRRSSS